MKPVMTSVRLAEMCCITWSFCEKRKRRQVWYYRSRICSQDRNFLLAKPIEDPRVSLKDCRAQRVVKLLNVFVTGRLLLDTQGLCARQHLRNHQDMPQTTLSMDPSETVTRTRYKGLT
jgi:hypothetical protein